MPASRSVYIYYKTRPESFSVTLAALRRLEAAMAEAGYRCRVQQRCDLSSEGQHTWMEIYDAVPEEEMNHWRQIRLEIISVLGLSGVYSGEIFEVFVDIH
jgi:hypothetical protein